MPEICFGCGEWFDPASSRQKYCSEDCKARGEFLLKEARAHASQVNLVYRDRDWRSAELYQADHHGDWRAAHRPMAQGGPERPAPDAARIVQFDMRELEAANRILRGNGGLR